MIKSILSILILVSFLLDVRAQGLPDETDIENATIFCRQKGGMYAINFTESRVWQGEPGSSKGIELSQVYINAQNAPDYIIQGRLFGEINVQIEILNKKDSVVAQVTMTYLDDNQNKQTDYFGPLICGTTNVEMKK